MKKTFLIPSLVCLLSLSFLTAQQAQQEEKEDPMANFSLVEKVQPVPENVKAGFESIKGHDALTYLKYISSDLMEGRDTATRGYALSAEYAASMFELWGIKPAGDFEQPRGGRRMMFRPPAPQAKRKRTYYQNITFREITSSSGRVEVTWRQGARGKSRSFRSDQDYSFYARVPGSMTAPVVFVGYGIQEPSIKFDEYKNLDVKGKFVMMLSETPRKDDPESPFNKGELKEKYNPPRRMMRRRSDPKAELAQKMGALGVIMVENRPRVNSDVPTGKLPRPINDEQPIIPGGRRQLSVVQPMGTPLMMGGLPSIRISREMADAILDFVGDDVESLKAGIEKDLKPQSKALAGVSFTVDQKVESKLVQCRNVLGFIEGSDPELKDEVVVIGAHLDHLGMRGDYIYNGADDNGSGSVGVMECAEAFALNPVKPKRSVLFALWTGEEKGLYGSRFYVANPLFPIEKTVCVNLDMISRTFTEESLTMMSRMFGQNLPKDVMEKIDVKNFVRPSFDAKAPELKEIMRANNQYVGLSLFLRGSESAMGGSDHAPFGMAGRPWIFFGAAMTEDYHQPSDSVGKVSSELMEKIIRLTYLTTFDLADK